MADTPDLNSGTYERGTAFVDVYASKDNSPKDGTIDANEAKKFNGSIFAKGANAVAEDILKGFGDKKDAMRTNVISFCQSIIDGFKGHKYIVKENVERDFQYDQKDLIDEQVEKEMAAISDKLFTNIKSAADRLVTSYQNRVTYKGAENKEDRTEEYKTYTASLEKAQWTSKTKEVNGVKQQIWVDPNTNKEYIIDDAGKPHELVKTSKNGFFRNSKYTIKDDLQNAGIMNQDGEMKQGYELKRRKVNGKYQTVAISHGSEGQIYGDVITHDNNSGETSKYDVSIIETRGKDKFASNYSGLNSNGSDAEKQIDGRKEKGIYADDPKDGESVRTYKTEDDNKTKQMNSNKARMNLDVNGQSAAVEDVISKVSGRALISTNQDITAGDVTIKFYDNVEYTLKQVTGSKSQKRKIAAQNDQIMENIMSYKNKLDSRIMPPSDNHGVTAQEAADADTRVDANKVKHGENGDTVAGENDAGDKLGIIRDVNNSYSRRSNPSKVHEIHYKEGTFTKADFIREGWARSADHKREKEILAKMDEYSYNEKYSVYTRSLQTVDQFTEVYVESNFSSEDKANIDKDKLAKAIKIANPSFFDEEGKMYKNVDFNRINFPDHDKVLEYYAKA